MHDAIPGRLQSDRTRIVYRHPPPKDKRRRGMSALMGLYAETGDLFTWIEPLELLWISWTCAFGGGTAHRTRLTILK
jgi:hypothetical protein